jgi:serine/threonine-protein kinase ATR
VGHIVGLGDRHGDNILIDTQLGECVHVDFDCLFDKGLKLQRPEIVPFRLTPCMVDAMGLTGYEGVFRHSMEACMQVLRDNKELLIGVLKPFIQDPTVAWGRGGRAQQKIDLSAKQPTVGTAALVLDSENKDAEEALRIITERLNGIYNIYHPKATKIIQSYKAQGRVLPKMGLGASQEEAVLEPLSVEGQVDRLIVEATAEINLAQMYHGKLIKFIIVDDFVICTKCRLDAVVLEIVRSASLSNIYKLIQ